MKNLKIITQNLPRTLFSILVIIRSRAALFKFVAAFQQICHFSRIRIFSG